MPLTNTHLRKYNSTISLKSYIKLHCMFVGLSTLIRFECLLEPKWISAEGSSEVKRVIFQKWSFLQEYIFSLTKFFHKGPWNAAKQGTRMLPQWRIYVGRLTNWRNLLVGPNQFLIPMTKYVPGQIYFAQRKNKIRGETLKSHIVLFEGRAKMHH